MLSRIGKKDKKNTSLIDGIVSSDNDRCGGEDEQHTEVMITSFPLTQSAG
jgi:hypothetical protein